MSRYLVPAAVRDYIDHFDGSLFFPVFWIGGSVLILFPICILSIFVWARGEIFLGLLSCGFIVTTMGLFVVGFDWTGDWIRFLGFEMGLEQLPLVRSETARIGPVYHWRGWGIAGMENDAYLVSDRSGDVARLPLGAAISGSVCPIADNRPMMPPWRLVATYECNLFGP
jgi:hypothetical protein